MNINHIFITMFSNVPLKLVRRVVLFYILNLFHVELKRRQLSLRAAFALVCCKIMSCRLWKTALSSRDR